MYVDYLTYQRFTHNPLVEDEYNVAAAYADAFIDNLTLGRVGKAVSKGEDLPEVVQMVYSKIIELTEDLMDPSDDISSFSNGVDSYTFNASKSVQEKAAAIAAQLLPVEWCSACVSYEGGNAR